MNGTLTGFPLLAKNINEAVLKLIRIPVAEWLKKMLIGAGAGAKKSGKTDRCLPHFTRSFFSCYGFFANGSCSKDDKNSCC